VQPGTVFSCRRCVFGVVGSFSSQVFVRFWATVCKTVRPLLSGYQPFAACPVLSVTLVYCGQTVEWIKMKLGMQVGLGPGHIVLDGDPAPSPPPIPNFRPMSIVATVAHLSYC